MAGPKKLFQNSSTRYPAPDSGIPDTRKSSGPYLLSFPRVIEQVQKAIRALMAVFLLIRPF